MGHLILLFWTAQVSAFEIMCHLTPCMRHLTLYMCHLTLYMCHLTLYMCHLTSLDHLNNCHMTPD